MSCGYIKRALDKNEQKKQINLHSNIISKDKLSKDLYNKMYNKDECVICLQETLPTDKIRVLSCNHSFHKYCIDIWLCKKPCCPICSRDLFNTKNK